MVSQRVALMKTVKNALVHFPSSLTILVQVVNSMIPPILIVDTCALNVPKDTPEIIAKGKEKRKCFTCSIEQNFIMHTEG